MSDQIQADNQTIIHTLALLERGLETERERRRVRQWLKIYRSEVRQAENMRRVLWLVIDGYDDIYDIITEAGLPYSTVYKILGRLALRKLITVRKQAETSWQKKGRNKYIALDSK